MSDTRNVMQNRLTRAQKRSSTASAAFLIGAAILSAVSMTGCGASGGGVSVGNFTGSGTLDMTLSGVVVDSNNAPLPGYTVSIDNHKPALTDRTGNYSMDIPTIDILPKNTIRVFDAKNALAHVESRPIDTAICVQTLQPIVVGPPGPP